MHSPRFIKIQQSFANFAFYPQDLIEIMSYTIEQVMGDLSHVRHPQAGKDIVALNMLSDIRLGDGEIGFTLTFQKWKDPLSNSIRKACEKALQYYVDPSVKVTILTESLEQPETTTEILPLVKNIIAVSSGKGGVGKSTVAVNLAVSLAKKGYRTGLIDADVYGPSIPKMFHTEGAVLQVRQEEGKDYIIPAEKYGVKLLSVGYFVKPEDAVVWRGPMATSALKQLIQQGDWGELDYLLIDLPPGTGDVHLTMVQEVPVTGAIIVSTPQQVALADVIKGLNMFRNEKINVPVLGLVENMSWFTPEELPGNRYYIFGKEGCKKLAEEQKIPLLGQIPLVQSICESGDSGEPVALDETHPAGAAFSLLADTLVSVVETRNRDIEPTRKVNIHAR